MFFRGVSLFYEFVHPATTDYFMTATGKNYEFPAHIQECFELIIVTKGTLNLTINDKTVHLKENNAVLIFPNLIHSMLPNECEYFLCIFSPILVSAYYSKVSKLLPDDLIFDMPENLLDILKNTNKNSSTIAKKGILYLICEYFNRGRTYSEQNEETNNVLVKIFHYIENNFKNECNLKSLSNEIGYDYTYISRLFKNTVGVSFNNYVNFYRLNNACYLFENTKQSITNCALESGYTSIRSFNRNFKKHFGVTPSEYTKK